MTIEEALVILEAGLEGRLSRIQELVFSQVWDGLSYSEIAANCGYDEGYIKNVASQLWRILSKAFDEKVTKSNVQSVVKRRPSKTLSLAPVPVLSSYPNQELNSTANILDSLATETSVRQDWGEAIDTSLFYGRTAELTTLKQWVVNDSPKGDSFASPCRLVTLLGMGGIGKTALAAKFAQQVENEFEFLIWRSLRNAPPIRELLVDLIEFLDKEHQTELPENTGHLILRLIELLRKQRCLLILDNVESIFLSSELPELESDFLPYPLGAGCYPHRYEGYGELFKQIGEASHQSCVVLTSREQPKEIAILEGESRPVRSLRLKGLGVSEAKELLKTKGLIAGEDEVTALVERYDGNPLALMIVSETIKELFNGKIADFFMQNSLMFGELYELLDQQFSRLSKFEKELLYWLTLNDAPVSIMHLFNELLSPSSKKALIETLCALRRRSLVEISACDSVVFTLKPLVREYITHRLTQESCEEILQARPLHLASRGELAGWKV
ncbi:MAG: NACHT domain-containing protein [Coleofasciculus sp. Co-bin14]|nr:NACHT domain-containing protein [Coleofasciculus sp. Co-bin14]